MEGRDRTREGLAGIRKKRKAGTTWSNDVKCGDFAALRSGRPRAAFVTVPVTSGSQWLKSMNRLYEYEELRQRAVKAIAVKAATGQMEMVDRFDIMVPDPLTRARHADKKPFALETFFHISNYEPIAEAHNIQIPVGMIGIRDDVLVPFEQTTSLYERVAGPKHIHVFDHGHHHSVYNELLPSVGEQVLLWFDTHLKKQPVKNTLA